MKKQGKEYHYGHEMKNMNFYESLCCAIAGLKQSFKTEKNLRKYMFFAVAFLIINFALKISVEFWLIFFLSAVMLLASEFINTGIEYLCNYCTDEIKDGIRDAKDVAATAVMFTGTACAIVEATVVIVTLIRRFG